MPRRHGGFSATGSGNTRSGRSEREIKRGPSNRMLYKCNKPRGRVLRMTLATVKKKEKQELLPSSFRCLVIIYIQQVGAFFSLRARANERR